MIEEFAGGSEFTKQGVYAFGGFRLDTVRRTVLLNSAPVALTTQLFETLLYLVRHHGRLVTREELLREIWPDRAVEPGSLDRAISSLRLALRDEDAQEQLIVTARGRGYRLAASVTFTPSVSEPEPAAAPTLAAPALPEAVTKFGKTGLVLAAMLVVSTVLIWRLWPGPVAAPFTPPPRSVAVMPFTNAGADRNATIFADGLSEELINALGRIGTIRVAARQSSFSFRNRQASATEIARQLNVATLLEGSVRRQGTRVRITTELIDSVSGYQLWASSYDRDQGDILSMQGEITAAVIASLKIVLAGPEAARLTLGGTADAAAFEAYLTGMTSLSALDHAANTRAIAAFDRAIALDPRYAVAYAHRAEARMDDYMSATDPDPVRWQRIRAAALSDADKAVQLAPDLDAGHIARAFALKLGLSHFAEAGAEVQRAVELAPSSEATLTTYAVFQRNLGHTAAALEAASRAVELDPLTSSSHRRLALILAMAGQFGKANEAMRRARLLPPAQPDSDRVYEGLIETLSGDYAAARKTCAGERDYFDLMCLAIADHSTGRIAEANADVVKLRALIGDGAAMPLTRIYAQWGQVDQAVQWLQTAYRLHDPGLIDMRSDPVLATLHARPEYQEIERALDFPP